MRIAIIGAGAVGAYFGAHLAAAGNDVVFVARGKHLVALQNNGLVIRGARGDHQVASSAFVSPGTHIGSVDVVLLCVKLYDLESGIELARPLVNQGAVCVTLQNGVDAQDRAAALLGDGHVMGGAAFVSAVIESPGVIRYTSAMSSIIFGEKDGSLSARALALEAVCKAAMDEICGFGHECRTDQSDSTASGLCVPRQFHASICPGVNC
jgi:2-dehydropantoate 2-reductase